MLLGFVARRPRRMPSPSTRLAQVGDSIGRDHCRPLLADLLDVEADPREFVVVVEGEEVAKGYGGSVPPRRKIAQDA